METQTRLRQIILLSIVVVIGIMGVILLSGNSSPVNSILGASSVNEPFFFIQMSDPQLGMSNYARDVNNFEQAIEAANRLQPDFVIITGDLTHIAGVDEGEEKTLNPEWVADFHRIKDELDETIPLYLVSGNHDTQTAPSQRDLEIYREEFGDDQYVFEHKGSQFVILNSQIIQHPEEVSEEADQQKLWLEQTLSEVSTKHPDHIFAFQHISWFLEDVDERDRNYNIPKKHRRDYVELFADTGVTAVFSGHYHGNSYASYRDVEYVTTGSVGKPMRDDPSGFRIVKVYSDRIEHEYVTLENPPTHVSL